MWGLQCISSLNYVAFDQMRIRGPKFGHGGLQMYPLEGSGIVQIDGNGQGALNSASWQYKNVLDWMLVPRAWHQRWCIYRFC